MGVWIVERTGLNEDEDGYTKGEIVEAAIGAELDAMIGIAEGMIDGYEDDLIEGEIVDEVIGAELNVIELSSQLQNR